MLDYFWVFHLVNSAILILIFVRLGRVSIAREKIDHEARVELDRLAKVVFDLSNPEGRVIPECIGHVVLVSKTCPLLDQEGKRLSVEDSNH